MTGPLLVDPRPDFGELVRVIGGRQEPRRVHLVELLIDDPELVAAVFDRWGQKVLEFYETVITMETVGMLFHGDDLGFKTSTMVSPEVLRRLAFPWFRRFAEVAHAQGKMYWYHYCGNIYSTDVIEDLIEDVGIDALHSF